MTTVFDDAADEPRMHALVIGVGAYPYFSGGENERRSHPLARNLGQLTCAPRSAEAIGRWLMGERHGEPVVPLGSLEMAISLPRKLVRTQGSGGGTSIEPATFDRVLAAFDRWRRRLDANERNIGFFFFSGHGIQREVLALLMEDSGAEPDRFFENAIDFDTMYAGMAKCRAMTQCFFVDTCRSVPIDVLDIAQFRPRAPIEPDWHRPRRDAPIVFATGYGQLAYGMPGQCSRFTAALLRALNGLGAGLPKLGRWPVTTESIGPAVRQLLEWDTRSYGGYEQLSKSGGDTLGGPIHIIPAPPRVPFRLGCRPVEALGIAELALVEVGTGRVEVRRDAPVCRTWEGVVRADKYSFEARFAGGGFRDTASDLYALPPSVEECVLVEPG
jgi:hypothetical protein